MMVQIEDRGIEIKQREGTADYNMDSIEWNSYVSSSLLDYSTWYQYFHQARDQNVVSKMPMPQK
jgi:hypothetical protein